MKKYVTNIILSILVAFIPFLGFPQDWKTVILVVTGLTMAIISSIIYSKEADRIPKSTSGQSFIDNKDSRKIQL